MFIYNVNKQTYKVCAPIRARMRAHTEFSKIKPLVGCCCYYKYGSILIQWRRTGPQRDMAALGKALADPLLPLLGRREALSAEIPEATILGE